MKVILLYAKSFHCKWAKHSKIRSNNLHRSNLISQLILGTGSRLYQYQLNAYTGFLSSSVSKAIMNTYRKINSELRFSCCESGQLVHCFIPEEEIFLSKGPVLEFVFPLFSLLLVRVFHLK